MRPPSEHITGNLSNIGMSLQDFYYKDQLQGLHIRVIRIILTTPREDQLHIALETVALEGAKYEALSYVWGDAHDTREIICNDQRLRIGVNLYNALISRRRRLEGASSLVFDKEGVQQKRKQGQMYNVTNSLWADAISINQRDNTEKTAQVRLMKDIYARAELVIAWLGNGVAEDDYRAVSFAVKLYELLETKVPLGPVGRDDDLATQLPQFPGILEYSEWGRIFELLSNPWFTRVWIVQELVMGKIVVAHIGNIQFGMVILLWIARLMANFRDLRVKSFGYDCGPAYTMAEFWQRYRTVGPLPLFSCAKSCSQFSATDMRDKLFALAGLSHSVHPTFVDYDNDFRNVAIHVGAAALMGNPSWPEVAYGLDCLAFTANPQNKKLGIPTWVPDYYGREQRGSIDLSAVFSVMELKTQQDVPKNEIRGIEYMGIEYQSVDTVRVGCQVDLNEIAFKASQIDSVKTALQSNLQIDSANDKRNARRDLDAHATYESHLVAWLGEARRLANPALALDADIHSGEDFPAFVNSLHYDYDPHAQAGDMPMHLSFCYWFMLKKFFLRCHALENMSLYFNISSSLASLGRRFDDAYDRMYGCRNFFVSHYGRIGWLPLCATADDPIFVFQGSRIPFIARCVGSNSLAEEAWEYLGPCYVHGLMNGEAWDLAQKDWRFIRMV